MLTIPIPAANSVQHNTGHARGSQLERVASQQRRILKEEALFKIYQKKTTICAVVDSLSFSYCTRLERKSNNNIKNNIERNKKRKKNDDNNATRKKKQ